MIRIKRCGRVEGGGGGGGVEYLNTSAAMLGGLIAVKLTLSYEIEETTTKETFNNKDQRLLKV